MSKIIADACANHCGSRELMDKMIRAAAEAGVDSIKFQSFKAKKLHPDWPDYKNALKYYRKHELSEKTHEWIVKRCQRFGIEPLFTAFDTDSAEFLATLGLERVKIASPDCNNWPLIDRCLDKFEHVLISTGMHSLDEVKKLSDFLGFNERKVTVLHCVSLYPTPSDKVGMARMAKLMRMFDSVGFSDHSLDLDASKLALSLGVACVERHFTLDRALPGKDHCFSSTPDEFKELVRWRDAVSTMMYCSEEIPDAEARRYIDRWKNSEAH